MAGTLVIGIGNRDRGDDGVGPAVVEELRRRHAGVDTTIREGDLSDVALEWDDHDDVVLVDAAATDGPAGWWTVIELAGERAADDPMTRLTRSAANWSTHGIGLTEAIGLAARLGRLPDRLRLLLVAGDSFDPGPLTRNVRTAVGAIADELTATGPVSARTD